MRSKRTRTALAFILSTILLLSSLLGCGGSGNTSFYQNALPVFVAGSVTEAERTTAITDVKAFFGTVVGGTNAGTQLVEHMKSLPEFATAEISPSGDAIGWFKDGVMLSVILKDGFNSTRRGRGEQQAKASKAAVSAPPISRDVPGTTKAYLVNSKESSWDDASADYSGVMNIHGYDTVIMSGYLADYSNIKSAGILYTNARGFVSRSRTGETRRWMGVRDVRSVETMAQYAPQIEKGTVAVAIWQNHGAEGVPAFMEDGLCMNDQFLLDSGMTFTVNSLWVNETSFGGGEEMVRTAASFNGLSEYASWNGLVDSYDAFRASSYLFDRMLGENIVLPADSPTLAPYTIQEVVDGLNKNHDPETGRAWDTSVVGSGTAAKFLFTRFAPDLIVMIPSVDFATVDKEKKTMEISGYFGSEHGAVTINGSNLTVKTWEPERIVVDEPSITSGKIVVRSLGLPSASGLLSSNAFQWDGLGVKITPDAPSLQRQEAKAFSAEVTGGTVPSGAKYKWTVTTGTGTVNGGATATTTTPSVSYVAPNADSDEVLKVQLLSSTGTVLAEKTTAIHVGNTSVTISQLQHNALLLVNERIDPQFVGTLPSGSVFQWTLVGDGTIALTSGQLDRTGNSLVKYVETAGSVHYIAPTVPATGEASDATLSLRVVSPTGAVLGTASMSFKVGGVPFYKIKQVNASGVEKTWFLSTNDLASNQPPGGVDYDQYFVPHGSRFNMHIRTVKGSRPSVSSYSFDSNLTFGAFVYSFPGDILNGAPSGIPATGTLTITSKVRLANGHDMYGYTISVNMTNANPMTGSGAFELP